MSFVTDTQDFKTIIDFIRYGISRARSADLFYGHGTDNAEDDIFALVWDSLSLPWEPDPQFLQARVTQEEKKMLAERLEKRIVQRIPVPYLTQNARFCNLSFYVDERVLIPRSPIAQLIQQQFVPWIEPEQVTQILDLCTGSGCIAIACCVAFPDATVVGTDLSEDALTVAAMNIERQGLQEQMNLKKSDCFDQIPHSLYDIIVSNPPYVAQAVMQNLPVEYTREPRMALFAEQKGLAVVDKILHQAGKYLSEHGILVVEVGESAEDLIELYPNVPFVWLDFEQGGDGVFLLTAQMVREFF